MSIIINCIKSFVKRLRWSTCGFSYLGKRTNISLRCTIKNQRNVYIDDNVYIDRSCILDGNPYIKDSITIGRNVQIKPYALLLTQTKQGYIKVGQNCYIGPFVVFYGDGGIEIGDNVLVASHVVIASANHGFNNARVPIVQQKSNRLPIKIGNDVWIGAGAKILYGVEIGSGCVIGAGAVVTKNLLPFSVAVGVPARVIKKRL